MSIVLKLSSIKTPYFFHTFTVNFALTPVILHPLQNGVGNLEMVYCLRYQCVPLINNDARLCILNLIAHLC